MLDGKYGKLVDFVHVLINHSYSGHDNLNFVDATCGNGFDTLFLCKLAGKNGRVTGLDVQKEAVERTITLLSSNLEFVNYDIILESHEFINNHITNKIDAAVFNLGYLPYSDKTITTKGDTTLRALKNIIPLLNDDGRIYITTYITHDTGDEIKEILNFLKSLDKTKFNVLHINLINKENTPPELFIIEKNA